jgi:predicted GNAT superfamily acetyltransferase
MPTEIPSITSTGTDYLRDYLWETYQRRMVEHDWGFYCFSLFENYLFVSDIYVEPRQRGMGIVTGVLTEISALAEEKGKDYLGTKVSTIDKTWENNLEICEHLGFERVKTNPEYIFLMRRRD